MRFQQIHAELASKFIRIRRPSETPLSKGVRKFILGRGILDYFSECAQIVCAFLLSQHSNSNKIGWHSHVPFVAWPHSKSADGLIHVGSAMLAKDDEAFIKAHDIEIIELC